MKRREFLKDIAAGSFLLGLKPSLLAQEGSPPPLAQVDGDSPAAITREAIASLGGMKTFVARGDRVMIKPNIGWDRTPELAACTNPEVVKTLVELCFDAGAKEVTVMDHTINQAQRCYARSGIAEAAKAAGAKTPYVNPFRLKKMALGGQWLKEWEVYTDFVEADKLINVPIAKHHSLSRLTMGMKNWLGSIGGSRNQLHQRIDEAMVDLAAFFKPELTVLDAYRILVRNGPQGGRLSDVKLQKTVVAGKDSVAVDSLGATFFGISPQELPYLEMARKRGLGENNLEKIRVEKRTV
ncbi:MAG: DUF362 domain-containing protein [Clostridiales bacterium]|nr:DUF362 domain-containing protein [Clostridiales bacterium]